jgi:hypothetical protein
MTSGNRPFSVERLDKLLTEASEYTFWRHDVDVSLFAALEMAEFEAERGISAIYYLFFDGNCPFYSAYSALETGNRLRKLGHDVGIHVDERLSDLSDVQPGMQVSFHCPTEEVLWKDFNFIQSAYASHWEHRYVSDSGGKFSYGDPEDVIYTGGWQVNLHPEWWFSPNWLFTVNFKDYENFFHKKHPYDQA